MSKKDELLGLLKSNIKNFNETREKSNNEPVDLTGADLTGTNLCRANLENITLKDAELNFAYLHSSILRNAIMTDLVVGRADMTEADLSGADLSGADLTNTILYGANLSNIKGNNIILEGSKLREANLSGANLSCGNLSSLDLTGVNLEKANLKGTDFTNSNLSAALNLEKAIYDQTTLFPSDITNLPEGFDPSLAPPAEMIETMSEAKTEPTPVQVSDFEGDIHQEYEFIDAPQDTSEPDLITTEEEFHTPDFQTEGGSAGTEAGFEDLSRLKDFSSNDFTDAPQEELFNQVEPGLAIPDNDDLSTQADGIGELELEEDSAFSDSFSSSFDDFSTKTEAATPSIGSITEQDFPIQSDSGIMAPNEDLSGGLDLIEPEPELKTDSFEALPTFGEEPDSFETLPAFGEESEPFEPAIQADQDSEEFEAFPTFGEETDSFDTLPAFGEESEPFEPTVQTDEEFKPTKDPIHQSMQSIPPVQTVHPEGQDTPVFADSFGQAQQPLTTVISTEQLEPIMDLLKAISGKLDKIETEQKEQKEVIDLLKGQTKELKTKSDSINTELIEESLSGKLKEATIFTQKLIQKVESKIDIVAQSDPLEHIDNLLAELSESISEEQESIQAKVVDISTVLDSVVSLLEVDSFGSPDIDLTEITNNFHQMLTNLESNIREEQESTARKIDDLATILEESKLNISTIKDDIKENFSANIKGIEDTVENINDTMGTLIEISQDDTKDSQVFEAFYDFEFRIQLELEKSQNKLSNLENLLEEASKKLINLDEKSSELNKVNGSEEIRKLLESLKTQLSEQIQKSEEKTGKLNDAVDDMLIQLESLFNLKLENINTDISEINQKLDTITTAKPSEEIIEIQTGLRVVQSDVQNINGNVREIQNNFGTLEREVQKSNDQLFSINSNINDLANKLESLKDSEPEVDDELRSVFEHIIVQFNDFSENTKDNLGKVNKKLNNLEIEVQMSLKDTDKNISKINGMIRKVYKALDNLTDLVTEEQGGIKIQPYTTDIPRTTLHTPRLNNDFDNEY